MESLRTGYTEVWCAGQNVPLARFADSARSIVSAGLDRLGFLPADDVVERLRTFDAIVSWYGGNRPEFRELTARLGLPVQFLPALPDGRRHAVDFYNDQARSLGGKPKAFPTISVPELSRTYAVIHPFASAIAKRVPMEVFEQAVERLSARMRVFWTCGPEESLPAAKDVRRFDDLHELACWLRGAAVFVGNDSGISHMAAAVGTPATVFFRASDPRVWCPRGPAVNALCWRGPEAPEASAHPRSSAGS